MVVCKDASINYLNSLGYNVISLPREGIKPLTILSRDSRSGIASIYADITDMVANPVPEMPKVFENLKAGTISGLRTNKLEFNFGISLLKTFLSALGGKSAGIESVFDRDATIEFEYENVLYDTVMPASVSKFLRSGKPSIDPDFITRFNEQGEAYVIIDVLKSNSFGIRAYKEDDFHLDIHVDALKDIVGASSKIAIEKKDDLKISFKGNEALGFGFKAGPIWAEMVSGALQFRLNPNTNQDVVLRGPETDEPTTSEDEEEITPVLLASEQLMELN